MDQETLTEMVKPSIDYVRHKRFRSGNYPSSLSNETDRLVHWCHGAPGVIHMLMQAYKVRTSTYHKHLMFRNPLFPLLGLQFDPGQHIWLQTKNLLEFMFLQNKVSLFRFITPVVGAVSVSVCVCVLVGIIFMCKRKPGWQHSDDFIQSMTVR